MKYNFDPHFRTVLIAAITSFVVAAIATAGLFSYLLYRSGGASKLNWPPIISNLAGEGSVVAAVKKANPAVVSIAISKNVPVLQRYLVPNPFGGFFSFIPQYEERGMREENIGGGSGFLVSANGYIVTNRHVVDDQTAEYTVFTNDGGKHAAKVVSQDPVLDLALIKIDGQNFPYLSFGDSDQLQVGQTAIAIGNALGEFRNTVSVGVVSGLSRSIVAGDPSGQKSESLEKVIQTDAAINSGNSGGPLLDLNGQVVGINVAMAVGSENIGFALPANEVKDAVKIVVADSH